MHLISNTPLSLVMLTLVVFMGAILVAFSVNYMAGENRVAFYWRWLLLTLSAVSLVVISNHLLMFWLGWVAISLALHQLLTFYPERTRAAIAAHKKFILARSAELALLAAISLLYEQHQTFYISELVAYFNQVAASDALHLTQNDQIAAVLIAITALIKCAQLPIHGWLIQVVEAPTPVSALLHAGVINLGGFLLILFAPLFLQVAVAQWLVLIVAGLTTVVSALIMTTRISFKVMLAWSTSAQMGLMLLEVALGLVELALLHLLAHSAYKAHAFLNSGSAVYQDLQRRLSPASKPSVPDWMVGALTSVIVISVAGYAINYHGVWSIWLLMGIAIMMLIAQRHSHGYRAGVMPVLVLATGLVATYSALKLLAGFIIEVPPTLRVEAFSAPDWWAFSLLLSLFLISWLLKYRAHWRLIQRLSIALFAAFYLDEIFTYLTLRIWPVRLPVRANAKVLSVWHMPHWQEENAK
jgi:NAD(P)H-quinone oxidoreductase subunit 5